MVKGVRRWRLVHRATGQPVFADATGNDVWARTRGEARAAFKVARRVRLPQGLTVAEVRQ